MKAEGDSYLSWTLRTGNIHQEITEFKLFYWIILANNKGVIFNSWLGFLLSCWVPSYVVHVPVTNRAGAVTESQTFNSCVLQDKDIEWYSGTAVQRYSAWAFQERVRRVSIGILLLESFVSNRRASIYTHNILRRKSMKSALSLSLRLRNWSRNTEVDEVRSCFTCYIQEPRYMKWRKPPGTVCCLVGYLLIGYGYGEYEAPSEACECKQASYLPKIDISPL